MKLSFYGGARAVTGANYLLEFEDKHSPTGSQKILIDCGLYQGCNYCEVSNFNPFPYKPSEIERVFLTHAHIDHSGRLPKLVKDGFKGTVFSTPPTKDFAQHLLIDSQHILARTAAKKNKEEFMYQETDVYQLLKQWQGIEYGKEIPLGNSGAVAIFHSAGHILGSASIEIRAEGKTILFSGDLGNNPSPLIGPADAPCKADYCLIESAYGDRIHEDLPHRQEKLKAVTVDAVKAGGALMIPAFSLERTQILLLEMKKIFKENAIPESVPVYLDSPLAIRLTEIYNNYRGYFKPEVASQFAHPEKIFSFPNLKMTMSTDQSRAIKGRKGPKIIIAGAGMSNAGRIIHHEKQYLPDPHSTLLIFGYQAEGTLGRLLLDGRKKVKILGSMVPVRAKIKAIGAYSAHADQVQLLNWAAPMKKTLKKMFVVQGEEKASLALAGKMKEVYGFDAVVPQINESVEL
ncbi:MAG: MBL fold metallo-hydrolase [Candidatus Harrisonbacteria bacterium]|nr:MBL fold metallo-hydrolase [Candidatus Harrisonbacteria bacterium]